MFVFKGISTKEMRIIVEEPDNLIAKAPIKHEILNIEGRDDAIYYPLGRSPIEITLTLQLLDPSKVDQVLMWLDGEGELIYKDRKTKARIFSEVQPIRTSGIRLINIDVVRAPYWDNITDDFSKPWGANLIPNGWDSFEPYGSGKNYFENWNFESDSLREFTGWKVNNTIENGVLTSVVKEQQTAHFQIDLRLDAGEYVVRYKVNHPDGLIETAWENTDKKLTKRGVSQDYNVYESFIKVLEEDKTTRIRLYPAIDDPINTYVGNKISLDWIQVTPIDNQHLVVEKTPLDNDLTRIQTWGGNSVLKLISTKQGHDTQYSASLYLETYKPLRIRTSQLSKTFETGYKGKYSQTENNPTPNLLRFVTTDKILPLDFIASDPQIVEGDKPPTWDADEFPRIINEGNAIAKPLIRLTKVTSSTCEFEVNGIYFKYHFNQDDEVVIDCEKMEASDEGQLRNRHLTIGYEFPKLDPGPNVVKTISGDAIIEFKRKDRWL